MKKTLTCIFLITAMVNCACINAAIPDTVIINNTKLIYQKINTSQPSKKGLIIYMHGGVSQFKGKEQLISLSSEELLEGNTQFLPIVQEKGYDIILPIAYNDYNWLETGGEQFIDMLLTIYAGQYKRIYISGFSDGATGAFRFFYNHPEKFDGIIVFNGYPQLNNYYKKVNHFNAIGKNIIYTSTLSDKVIPYEFLLIEFRRQQMLNEHTYFLLKEGNHAFTAYNKTDFELCITLLEKENNNKSTIGKRTIYPPVDGLVVDGNVKEVYTFRKKTGKNYSMTEQEYSRNDWDPTTYSKLLSNKTTIYLKPIEIAEQDIKTVKTFNYNIEINGQQQTIQLNNWLNIKTW